MRYSLAYLLIVFSLAACGTRREPVVRAPEATQAVGEARMVPNVGTVPQIRTRPFREALLPAGCRFEGRIVGGARWRDSLGENVVIVTWSEQAVKEDVRHQEIRGYAYVWDTNVEPRLLWKIDDAADNHCDDGRGLASEVEVRDLDHNGIAENIFLYNVAGPCDVSPVPFKLMLHSGDREYAIRGTTRVDVGDGSPVGGERSLDSALQAAPESFREYASDFWDLTTGQYEVRVGNVE